MRSRLLLVLLLTSFVSCKKEEPISPICWICTFEELNGVTRPPETICNENGVAPIGFKDSAGNDLVYECILQ